MLLNGTLVVSAYYASWSIYARNFEVSQLPFQNLTHINYAFAGVNSSGFVYLRDLWADVERPVVRRKEQGGLFGNLGALYEFKQEYPHLKVGLSIGGWGGSGGFSAAAASNQTRSKFAETALDLLLNLGLDFVDLDWEYPVAGGPEGQLHQSEDGRNYVLLLQEIKKSFTAAIQDGRWLGFQPPGISLALPCGQFTGRYDYLREMGELVDFANVMCYDFSGSWSSVADHHSNLFGRHEGSVSVDSGIKELLAAGFPARKTILGIPLYGRGFDECRNLTHSFNRSSTGSWDDSGIIEYKALNLRHGNCTPLIEISTKGTFCHDSELNRLLVYDSVTAIREKVEYVKLNGLAGLMFWEASADLYSDPQDGILTSVLSSIHPFKLDSRLNNLCYPDSIYENVNSFQNCTYKSGKKVDNFVPEPLAPVNMESVDKAKPFGSRIHQQIIE